MKMIHYSGALTLVIIVLFFFSMASLSMAEAGSEKTCRNPKASQGEGTASNYAQCVDAQAQAQSLAESDCIAKAALKECVTAKGCFSMGVTGTQAKVKPCTNNVDGTFNAKATATCQKKCGQKLQSSPSGNGYPGNPSPLP